jgi:hypothetical protein
VGETTEVTGTAFPLHGFLWGVAVGLLIVLVFSLIWKRTH